MLEIANVALADVQLSIGLLLTNHLLTTEIKMDWSFKKLQF